MHNLIIQHCPFCGMFIAASPHLKLIEFFEANHFKRDHADLLECKKPVASERRTRERMRLII